MMNVGIMFYAARETQDADLQHRVMEHCLTTRRYLVRGDGSTAHEGIFDLETGEFLRESTHQGLRGDSSWARGLAWSLYGFGTAYRYTRDRRFLETAELNADYYIDSTPLHGVPPNDFDAATGPHRQPESSAAAIAASGLLDLASFTPLRAKSRLYRDTALQILDTLTGDEYSGPQHARLGGGPEARRLPHPEGARRQRVGDVGRVFLRRGSGESAGSPRRMSRCQRMT